MNIAAAISASASVEPDIIVEPDAPAPVAWPGVANIADASSPDELHAYY
jgi:hypothetical protein